MPYKLTFAGYLACALLLCGARGAGAQTDEIQVYDAAIAPVGSFNLTWHNNYAVSAQRFPAFPGGLVPNHSLNGVTEWAYGVTPWFEAGLYLPIYSVGASGAVSYDGFKLRTLFVVPNAPERHCLYGVNFEFSDNTRKWDTRTFTAEIRPIVGWRWSAVELILNPILDYTSKGAAGLDFAPATRLAYRLTDKWSVAAEEYDDFGPLRHFAAAAQQSHQLFAVLDHALGKLEIEAGAGFGLTSGSDGLVLKLILARDLN